MKSAHPGLSTARFQAMSARSSDGSISSAPASPTASAMLASCLPRSRFEMWARVAPTRAARTRWLRPRLRRALKRFNPNWLATLARVSLGERPCCDRDSRLPKALIWACRTPPRERPTSAPTSAKDLVSLPSSPKRNSKILCSRNGSVRAFSANCFASSIPAGNAGFRSWRRSIIREPRTGSSPSVVTRGDQRDRRLRTAATADESRIPFLCL